MNLRTILFFLFSFGTQNLNASERVWILCNSELEASKELAYHYANARKIPESNIIQLPLPKSEQISFRQFVDKIYNPLVRALSEKEAIQVIFDEEKDGFGREKYFLASHRIDYLVTCFGVPLKFRNDPELAQGTEKPLPKQFNTLRAAVDSELSLIPSPGQPFLGPLNNPTFGQKNPSPIKRRKILRVSRLDGPSLETAKALVDNALKGERLGVWGRALVDVGGPHEQGDDWMKGVQTLVEDDLWEVTLKPTKQRFQLGDRVENAAIYFGWYTAKVDGPFKQEGFQFAPGAFGFHLHSGSASSLKKHDQHWTPALIDRGITATIGNVYEPYLHLTHQPQLMYEALREGQSWGEAVYYSLAGLSWQAISIGDPLYMPFPQGIDEAQERPSDNVYQDIRKLRDLEKSQGVAAAIDFGQREMLKNRTPEFVFEVALKVAESDKAEALKMLSAIEFDPSNLANTLPLWIEIAEATAAWGNVKGSLERFDALISAAPSKTEASVLKSRGRPIALEAVDFVRSAMWALPNEAPSEN